MKKTILCFLLFMVSLASAWAVNTNKIIINKIVFFGDSLSDNGNLYSLLLHLLPKSPPYFEGHFSNGITWAERVGKYYYDKNYADYKIYAMGGATAIFHMPASKFIAPTLLNLEVEAYLIDSLFKDKSKVLYSIWIGSNDYLFYPDVDPNLATEQIVNHIASVINTLKEYGGKNFLVMNLPDLSRVPEARDNGGSLMVQLHTLSVLHNQKLEAAVQGIENNDPEINIAFVDIFTMFNELLDDPDVYNKKYHMNITNTTDACWTGGYLFKKGLSETGLTKQIQRAFAMRAKPASKDFDAQAMSNYIVHTPELAFTYQMDQAYEQGNVPCANPDNYIFWDSLHPTGIVHELLAKAVLTQLEAFK